MERIYFESHNMRDKIHLYHHTTLERKPANYVIGFNWHESIELICATEGRGYIICNGSSYPMKPGDIFVINAHEFHGFTTEDTFTYDCIIVNSQFLSNNGIEPTQVQFQNLIQDEKLLSIYQELVCEINVQSDYCELAKRSKMLELFLQLMRHHLVYGDTQRADSKTLASVKAGIHFINNEFSSKISLDEIASAAGLSKYHFSREFKKATGSTVTSYLNMVRCNHAKLLLSNKEYSVHDVALLCGFTNDSLFSKTFRNVVGCAPSKVKTRKNQ